MFPSVVQRDFYLLYLSYSDYQRCWKVGLSKWVVVFSFCSFLKHLSFGNTYQHALMWSNTRSVFSEVPEQSGKAAPLCFKGMPGMKGQILPWHWAVLGPAHPQGAPTAAQGSPGPCSLCCCCPHETPMSSTMLRVAWWGFWVFLQGEETGNYRSFWMWNVLLWVISFQWWL